VWCHEDGYDIMKQNDNGFYHRFYNYMYYYYYGYWHKLMRKYKKDHPNDPMPNRSRFKRREETPKRSRLKRKEKMVKGSPTIITSVIALSLALLVLEIALSDKNPINSPLEPLIEWLPGILAIACAYNALWMLAYYCTNGDICQHLGIHTIIYLLRNRQKYGPHWFLEWILAAYFIFLIIALSL
jgi:hypothetical protein